MGYWLCTAPGESPHCTVWSKEMQFEWNTVYKRVYTCMSSVPVGFWVTVPSGDEFVLNVFLHLGLSCGSAVYPVCAQHCLSSVFTPSVTKSSTPAVKHRGLHKVIFCHLWYNFASGSILSCFIRHQSTRIFQVSVKLFNSLGFQVLSEFYGITRTRTLLVGDSLRHSLPFIWACISVSCVKLTVIKEPFLISIHSSYHCPY